MKSILFPFIAEDYLYIKYQHLFAFEKSYLNPVTINTSMITGKDAGFAYGEKSNCKITGDFKTEVSIVDSIIFLGCNRRTFTVPDYESYLRYGLDKGKEIYVTNSDAEYYKLQGSSKIHVLDCHQKPITNEIDYYEYYPPPVPVVLIVSTLHAANTLGVHIPLFSAIRKAGINIWHLSTIPYAKLFGIDVIPKELINENEDSKFVKLFRAFINQGCAAKRPQIIIISLEHYPVPLSLQVPGDYGLFVNKLSLAIEPKGIILLTYANFSNTTEIISLRQLVEGRLLANVLCSIIAPIYFDQQKGDELHYESIAHTPLLFNKRLFLDEANGIYSLNDDKLGPKILMHLALH